MHAVLAFAISYTLLPFTVAVVGPCRLCPLAINPPVSPHFFLAVVNTISSAIHHTKEALVTFQLHFHI
jgi:hypothetical protein